MTVKEALEKWSDACSASKVGEGKFVRDGNWESLARSLRHGEATLDDAGELNGDTVVLITPAEPAAPPKGKSKLIRPPFYLVVK